MPSLHSDEVDPGSQQRRRSATARAEPPRYAIEDYRDDEDERVELDEEDYLEAFVDEEAAYENQYLHLKDFAPADLPETVHDRRGERNHKAKMPYRTIEDRE